VYNVLASYGLIYRDIGGRVEILTNASNIANSSAVFLSKMNTADGLVESVNIFWNSSEIPRILEGTDEVYSNGYSEIFRTP
jgi:hypothetical protein